MASFYGVIQRRSRLRWLYVVGVFVVLAIWGFMAGFQRFSDSPSPAYPLNTSAESTFALKPDRTYRLQFHLVKPQLETLRFRFAVGDEAQGELQIEVGQAGSAPQRVRVPVALLRAQPQLDVSVAPGGWQSDEFLIVRFTVEEPGVRIWVRPDEALLESPLTIGWYADGERQPVVPLFRPQFAMETGTIWESDVEGYRYVFVQRWERLSKPKPDWVVWGMMASGVLLVMALVVGLWQWFGILVLEKEPLYWKQWVFWWVVMVSGFWFMGG